MVRLLDAHAFAKRWAVSEQTVYRWIHAGKIKATQLPSGCYRIPEDAIPEPSTTAKVPRLYTSSTHGGIETSDVG